MKGKILASRWKGPNCIKICSAYLEIAHIDMSGLYEKSEEYNKCFMHMSFSVYAHIYNLNQDNVSVFINEDARRIGVNHALGLENINCLLRDGKLDSRKLNKKEFELINLDYIKFIEQSKYWQYYRGITSMKENNYVMGKFISEKYS